MNQKTIAYVVLAAVAYSYYSADQNGQTLDMSDYLLYGAASFLAFHAMK